MQRANTPNANLLNRSPLDKCPPQRALQQCSPAIIAEQQRQQEQSNCRTGEATSGVTHVAIVEKNELNNNLLERKNANNNFIDRKNVNNESICSVDMGRWSAQSTQASNQATTPIYLHHPPSSNDFSYVVDTSLIRQARSTTQLSTSQQLQTVSSDDERAHQLHLQQSREDELQLHQINEAEQRMERRLRQRGRMTSTDSTSTESTKEERLNKDLPHPEYVRYSFNWLPQDSEWRMICLRMIANPWFERISMTAILINCITLGMYHPCADEICLRPKCRLLQMFDDIIFAFFALEMLIKMTAMGVRGTKGAYFSETWNRLDFFIVVSGVPEYIVGVGNINLSTIRTFRILRPLKAVKVIPSLRLLVSLLADTLPMLSNVLLLCFFVFFIFGIIGVQLWAGLLRQRCFLDLPPEFTLPLQQQSISLGEYYVEKMRNIDPIASHYQLSLEASDKEYICSLEKDNGMHRCADLPPTKFSNMECMATIEDYLEYTRYGGNDYTSDALIGLPSSLINNQLPDQLQTASYKASNFLSSSQISSSLPSSPIINDTMSSINNFNTIFSLRDNQSANCINWNRYYTRCKAGNKNPFQGTMSFDNVGMAWTAIFLVISLEGWTEIMYYVQDAHSFWDWLYFVLLIVIGSFFMINLCLVVIATQFSETKKREMERMRLERARYASSSSLGSNTNSEPTNCYNALLKYLAHLGRRAKRRLWRQYKQYRKRKRRAAIQQNEQNAIKSSNNNSKRAKNSMKTNHHLVRKSNSSSTRKDPVQETNKDTCIGLQPIEDDTCFTSTSTELGELKNGPLISSARFNDSNQEKQRPLISCLRTNRTEHIICPISEQNQANHLSIQTTQTLSTSHSANFIFQNSMRATNLSSQLSDGFISSNHNILVNSQRVNSNLTNLNSLHNVGSAAVLAAPSRRHGSVPTLYLRPNRSDNCSPNFLVSTLDGNYLTTTSARRNQLANNLNNFKPPMQLSLGNQPASSLHWSPGPTLMRSSESGQLEEEHLKYCGEDDTEDDEVEREYQQWVDYIEQTWWFRTASQVRRVLKIIVDHRYFQRFIFLSILINTLSMGAEYHEQPASLTAAVEYFNLFFTFVFMFEMILKIAAHGCYIYISDGFNVFDGIVVIVSVMEFMEKESGSGLSVLRTFRLLRILKLVRFMPALKRQLVIMLRTLDNVAVFFLLLVLFIFIFSILGMNLFGCKFCSKMLDNSTQCDRKNFDSLLWALVTVFQVLTQEDWGIVLFNGMERTTHWAALYFVVLMTFGNYVLFNLLVAILVEGFSQEKTDVESLEDEEQEEKQEVKDEKLIYFYGPKDNLEHEIELLKNSPGIITKLQSPNSHIHHLELDQHTFDKLKAVERAEPSNLAAAFAQAKLLIPNNKDKTNLNRHLSNSMKELHTTSSLEEDSKKQMIQTDKGAKQRRNSIRLWVTGAASKKYATACKQLKESLSRGSSFEKSDLASTSAPSVKHSKKITTSSSLLPQLSLKDDGTQTSSNDKLQVKPEKKRRMSTLTDWKPIFSSSSSPFAIRQHQETEQLSEIKKLIQIVDRNEDNDQFGSTSDRPNQLNKLEEEIEEEDAGEGITEISSSQMSKRSSAVAIHEMKPLSPGTSLSGVFYCSSSVHSGSNRKISLTMQTHTSPRASMHSVADENSSQINGALSSTLQRRSTMNLGHCKRRNRCIEEELSDKESEVESKRRSVSSDLNVDKNSQHSSFLTQHLVSQQSTQPTTSNYATIQPSSSIVRETIVEEIGPRTTNVPQQQDTAIDFNQADPSITKIQPESDLIDTFTTTTIAIRNANAVTSSRHSSYTSSSSKHRSSNSKSDRNLARHSSSLAAVDQQAAQACLEAGTMTPPRKFCVYFRWYSWMTKKEDYSLFIFPPDNKLRLNFIKITDHKCFDYVVLIFISLNCITLAMERPKIPPWSPEREILNAANYIFTFIFTLEMALKVIAKGFYYSPDAYLKSMWNKLDATLVGISLFDLFLTLVSQRSPRILGILRVFRLLRSLRPLRIINRAPGLKLVVQTLLSSLRPIGNIVLICCTFFVIFGILGVQLFKGALHYCEGPDVRFVRNKTDCLADPRNHWINRKYNFDNLGQALMALFVLSSKDGWVNIMYTGLDAVGVDQQPQENYNEWRLLYFISFLLLVAFFVLNMFVGVVVENFHRCRQQQELEERARRAEKRARKLEKRRRKMRKPPYYTYYSKIRLFTHKLVTGKYFDVAISGVIGLNVITMSLEYYQMPQELINTLKLFNFVFTSVFIVEAIFKVYALGLSRYFRDKWNQLDVLIVILSVVGIILEEAEAKFLPINPTIIRVMRVARIARVLKLLKMAKGMRALLNTVGNLGLLFYLLFFIFAALGVELFGRLECDDDHPCQGLSEHAHFQNFGMAFLTLFRIATGDNWNGIMKDTLRDECDPSSECLRNCCVSPVIAPMYFVVFVLLAQFVLVNVVVAVLMKHLEESHRNMEEEEDYWIDCEIARELAQEKAALEEAADRRLREQQLRKCRFKMCKMNSLPPNFKFQFDKYLAVSEADAVDSEQKGIKNGINSSKESREIRDLNSVEPTYEQYPVS